MKVVRSQIYVNGLWIESARGECFDVFDPAVGESMAKVADATHEQASIAMDAAEAALPAWAARSPRERAEILRRAYDEIIAAEDELAWLITRENGKALSDSFAEVRYAAEFFRWFAEEAVRNLGTVGTAPSSGARMLVQHRPAGVAVLVTPWNYPAAMGTRKIAPALAAGCTCVIKPAEETPLTMLRVVDLLERAGVPAGVVNVLPSSHSADVVSTMLRHRAARVVSFTGSTQVGRKILQEAAESVINPRMELGGNAPFIVCADADIEAAVEGAMIAKMRNLGEACTAANRFLVHSDVHDDFVERFAGRMAALTVGNGLESGVDVGPLINKRARDKVAVLVDDAVARGARVVTGGSRGADERGAYYLPTVLTDVPDDAACLTNEIFGPVAPVQRFTCEEDVILRANATEYGLVAYVYTKDMARGLRISERLEFGMVGLNRGMVSDPAAPFGGMKQSGLGREGAHEGLMEFLETQYVATVW